MDAKEIQTAVAHQAAARAAAEAPFVNLSDPARVLGPDGRPGRQPPRPDLRGRPRRAVERLALAALAPRERPRGGRADPEPHRRRKDRPRRPGQVPRRHHPVLHLADRPRRPRRPHPPPGDPGRVRAPGLHGDDGGLARRGPPLPGARARPPLPGPRPDARHDPVRQSTAGTARGRASSATRPRTSTAATTRPSSNTFDGRRRSATS